MWQCVAAYLKSFVCMDDIHVAVCVSADVISVGCIDGREGYKQGRRMV